MTNPIKCADSEYNNLVKMVAPLTKLLIRQQYDLGDVCGTIIQVRNSQRAERAKITKTAVEALLPRLSLETRRAVEMASAPGASNWLTALPLECYNLSLHKGPFRDTLYLRYHWPPPMLSFHCACNAPFNISHALSCPTGGIPSIRHNELRV